MKNKYTIGGICIALLLVPVVCFYSALSDFLFSYENKPQGELLKTILYVLGGIGALIGLWFTYRRTKSQENQIQEFVKQNKIAENGNVNDRFKNAIEHLGSDNEVISLGGIHSLHRIAKEHPAYRQTVFDILCSYIREKTKNIEVKEQYTDEEIKSHAIKPTICIQTTIDLLFKSKKIDDYIYVRLKANLQGVKCIGANFDNAMLEGADLRFSDLSLSSFSCCELSCAEFYKAYMYHSSLRWTRLVGAELKNVRFESMEFSSCLMFGADLRGAQLSAIGRDNSIRLEGAELEHTILYNIDGNFCGANVVDSTIPFPSMGQIALMGCTFKESQFTAEINTMGCDTIYPGRLDEATANDLVSQFSNYVDGDGLKDVFKRRMAEAKNTDTVIRKPNI